MTEIIIRILGLWKRIRLKRRVLNCEGGKDDVRAADLMRIFGALEVKRKLCFQASHIAGMDTSLIHLITHSERSTINAELKRRGPGVNWREQVN